MRFLPSVLSPLALCVAAQAGGVRVEFVGSFPPAVTQRVNAAGEVAGDFQFNAVTTAMRYTPALGRTPLAVPAGTNQSIATGINEAGAIVGRYSAGAGTFGAIWSPEGVLTTRATPPGTRSFSTPSDLNEAGVVCGSVILLQTGTDPAQAWRWTQKGGYELLPRIGGIVAECRDINNAGQVAGYGTITSGLARACVWQADGSVLQLGVPPGATQSFANGINDAGMVCGSTVGNEVPWRWTPKGGMQALPDFGFKATAVDINEAGWILGWADLFPFETVPVVWDPDGNLHDVFALVDQNRFYFPGDFIIPIAISDSNLIVVYGYDFTVSGDPRVLMFRVIGPSACTTDLDGDGLTGAADLARLLDAWGASGGAEDLDGDGLVGAPDLATLLDAWGACP
ncbi:MAG: hypothetical protein ACO31E_05545 [Phycisphaerales bacterium]